MTEVQELQMQVERELSKRDHTCDYLMSQMSAKITELSLALFEAIQEIEATANPESMTASKMWAHYMWIARLKRALDYRLEWSGNPGEVKDR